MQPSKKGSFLDKKGEELVEAAMVLPLTFLILLLVMTWMLTSLSTFMEQVQRHEEERASLYEKREVEVLRLQESLELLEQVVEE